MRIGQRSDSKSDAPKGVEGSNPLPSALFEMIFRWLRQPTVLGRRLRIVGPVNSRDPMDRGENRVLLRATGTTCTARISTA